MGQVRGTVCSIKGTLCVFVMGAPRGGKGEEEGGKRREGETENRENEGGKERDVERERYGDRERKGEERGRKTVRELVVHTSRLLMWKLQSLGRWIFCCVCTCVCVYICV